MNLPLSDLDQRFKDILGALDSIPIDSITATALAHILVEICVRAGVPKKQFRQILHDQWRARMARQQAGPETNKELASR